MTELKELNVFDKILEPVFPLIKEAQDKIPGDSNDYKLSLLPFTVNLLFAIIYYNYRQFCKINSKQGGNTRTIEVSCFATKSACD